MNNGSLWDNTELRYSLRSLEKFGPNIERVFIVGVCPAWLKDVIHIPSDNPGASRDMRIMNKVFLACDDKRMGESFLFMNDDHFLLKPFRPERFFFDTTLKEKIAYMGEGAYKRAVINTRKLLIANGKAAKHFDVHCPIAYNTRLFKKLRPHIDPSISGGYLIKSLYCNMYGIEGEFMPDLKVKHRQTLNNWEHALRGREWFSIGDGAIEGETGNVLQSLYPEKSRWEI